MAWFFAVPLFFLLEQKKVLARLGWGLVFSWVFYLLILSWTISYSVLGYLTLVGAVSVQMVFFTLFYPLPNMPSALRVFYIPSAWVASEYLRMKCLQGMMISLGQTQTFNLPVLQFASVWGGSGLSFVLILFNYLLYCLITRKIRRVTAAAGLVIIPLILFLYGTRELTRAEEDRPSLSILTVQPRVLPEETMTDSYLTIGIGELIRLTEGGLKNRTPDLVVWPETAVPTTLLCDPVLKENIFAFVRRHTNAFMLGTVLRGDGKYFNSAVLLIPEGEKGSYYHKQHLLPLTEYIPPGVFWKYWNQLSGRQVFGFSPGSKTQILTIKDSRTKRWHRFATPICSEETHEDVFRSAVAQKAGFFVSLLNDGWFTDKAAFVFHAQLAVLEAVSFRRPVVRVANAGWSCLIDEYGRVSPSFLEGNKKKIFYHQVSPVHRKSLYYIVGETFQALCFYFVVMVLMLFICKQIQAPRASS